MTSQADHAHAEASAPRPWYRRVLRWGQTNLTELDPLRYDAAWWRAHWQRTRVQGVIVNAGGIVAYYPSRYRLHQRAQFLGERDLYGEIVATARADGLAVLARMDSNRAAEIVYLEHPDWFAVDADGRPYRAGELYVACVNSPYYAEHLTGILREIIERSQPDGVTDNSWSGLDRDHICYCDYCVRKFRAATGLPLPRAVNWDDSTYRQWITWSYTCRIDVWELNNQVTRAAGGPDCLWLGMNSGDLVAQSQRLRDYRAICARTEIIMLDSQARTNARGFQSNSEMGKLLHGLLGWEKLIPESTALYGAGQPAFRLASKPVAEARLWAVAGFAGGIQPWWHHIGAYHEDRRQYRTAEPLFRWHEANEEYLIERQPVATVGVVWSRATIDFYGRGAPEERVALPQRGLVNALIRARIPMLPVQADDVERDVAAHGLALLVLPNIAALSDQQCAALRRFVQQGGSLLATGESSLYDEHGTRRDDFALADLFGVQATLAHHGATGPAPAGLEGWQRHTYLRLRPEQRAQVDGPQVGSEPPVTEARHPALAGFDETDTLPFAGRLEVVRAAAGTRLLATFVPPFPMYPPETSWMRHPTTDLPAVVLHEPPGGGRVAYLAADLDRCFGRDNLPDHADLLANLVRWAVGDQLPLTVEGMGLLDCHLYRQANRLILHLVNLTNTGAWRAPIHELTPVGPFQVRLALPTGWTATSARLLVAETEPSVATTAGRATFTVPVVTDHEVVVITKQG